MVARGSILLALILCVSGCARPPASTVATPSWPGELSAWCDALGWDVHYATARENALCLASSEPRARGMERILLATGPEVLPVQYQKYYPDGILGEVPKVSCAVRIEQPVFLLGEGIHLTYPRALMLLWYVKTDKGAKLLTNIWTAETAPWLQVVDPEDWPGRWYNVAPEIAEAFDALLANPDVWGAQPRVDGSTIDPVVALSLYRDGKTRQIVSFGFPFELFIKGPRKLHEFSRVCRCPWIRQQKLWDFVGACLHIASRVFDADVLGVPGEAPEETVDETDFEKLTGRTFGWDNLYRQECAKAQLPLSDYEVMRAGLRFLPHRWQPSHLYWLAAERVLSVAATQELHGAVRLEWPGHQLDYEAAWILWGKEQSYVLSVRAEDIGGPELGSVWVLIVQPMDSESAQGLFEELDKLGIQRQSSFVAAPGSPTYVSWWRAGQSVQYVTWDGSSIFKGKYPWERYGNESDKPPDAEWWPSAQQRQQAADIEHLIIDFVAERIRGYPLGDGDQDHTQDQGDDSHQF